MNTVQKLAKCRQVMKTEYSRKHSYPWVIAYSGGKDSTLLLQITWEILISLPIEKRHREIYIVGNDTLVESPLVIQHLRASMSAIKASIVDARLPIRTKITRPNIDQTFWVNVIGRGYIPPTRNFRWCTDRMKILPTSYLIESLVKKHGRAFLLVGTRKSESEHRRRNMAKHHVTSATMNSHDSVPGCSVFAPLADLEDEDIWKILLQRSPPWGGTHKNLITLYRNAGGGECPLVLSKKDAPSCGTSSPRFGCWTCTVVVKDRSMGGLIASGQGDTSKLKKLFNFREWLVELRENETNRQRVRRDGNVKTRMDGSRVLGPFKLEVRKRILQQLKILENQTGWSLLSHAEYEIIQDIWRRDRILKNCRDAFDRSIDASEIEVQA